MAVVRPSVVVALLLVLCIVCATAPAAFAGMEGVHIVGDKLGWVSNHNYSDWTNTTHIYPGDWIGFRFDKNMYDVAMVNKTAYETCDTSHLLWQYNKSVAYLQLNHTGNYYFICTRGYCFSQMKLAVLVEKRPTPTPSSAGKNIKNSASLPETRNFKFLRLALALFAVLSMIFRL
ncbi:hypothetical protein H6P81_019870 [Aristolochia fimbriata]|uniref:Phytocyanin domain-containing protein n=1 Tax=Aristolochia fimbriata TaxID=158543 RepID=A0AAV7DUR8_ARIFI|nr:hypothetical protein H6P81_019870 [Aristolochia fimbriata]